MPILARNAAVEPSAVPGSEADRTAAAALRALQAHLGLCLQLSLTTPHLKALEDAVLVNILSQRR